MKRKRNVCIVYHHKCDFANDDGLCSNPQVADDVECGEQQCLYGVKQKEACETDACIDCENRKVIGEDILCVWNEKPPKEKVMFT